MVIHLLIFIISLTLNFNVLRAADKKNNQPSVNREELVKKHMPIDFLSMKYKPTGELITKEDIRYSYVDVNFSGKSDSYFIAAYWTNTSLPDEGEVCRLILIRAKSDNQSSVEPLKLKMKNENIESSCSVGNDMRIDIDGDGRKELLINFNGSWGILKIFSDQLTDITPLTPSGEFLLGNPSLRVADEKIENSPLLVHEIYNEQGKTPNSLTDLFYYKDNKLIKVGGYAYFEIIKKSQLNLKSTDILSNWIGLNYYAHPSGEIRINWPVDDPDGVDGIISGTYELEIKNLSKHGKAVRVDLVVNGVQAIKPEDFCKEKPDKSKKDKDKDDDDDKNEDGFKHCKTKDSVKVNVQMKGGENILKMKMFGHKDSVVQLTINKKK